MSHEPVRRHSSELRNRAAYIGVERSAKRRSRSDRVGFIANHIRQIETDFAEILDTFTKFNELDDNTVLHTHIDLMSLRVS